jgi:hypothetical protein
MTSMHNYELSREFLGLGELPQHGSHPENESFTISPEPESTVVPVEPIVEPPSIKYHWSERGGAVKLPERMDRVNVTEEQPVENEEFEGFTFFSTDRPQSTDGGPAVEQQPAHETAEAVGEQQPSRGTAEVVEANAAPPETQQNTETSGTPQNTETADTTQNTQPSETAASGTEVPAEEEEPPVVINTTPVARPSAEKESNRSNFTHAEVKAFLEKSMSKDRVEAARSLIERAFRENKASSVVAKTMGPMTKRDLESGDQADGPEIFYPDQMRPVKIGANAYEAFVVIRMNNDGDDEKNTILLANVTVNGNGEVDLKKAPILSLAVSEKEYFDVIENKPQSLDAQWFSGKLSKKAYDDWFRKNTGMSIDRHWVEHNKNLEGTPEHWKAYNEAKESNLMGRLRESVTERVEQGDREEDAAIEASEDKLDQLVIRRIKDLLSVLLTSEDLSDVQNSRVLESAIRKSGLGEKDVKEFMDLLGQFMQKIGGRKPRRDYNRRQGGSDNGGDSSGDSRSKNYKGGKNGAQ